MYVIKSFLIPILVILAIVVLAGIFAWTISAIPKKTEYTKLDKTGFAFNIALGVIYVPISVMFFFSVMFFDYLDMYPASIQAIINVIVYIGLAFPLISYVSILVSAVLRRLGRSMHSFCVQFLPLVLFILSLIIVSIHN